MDGVFLTIRQRSRGQISGVMTIWSIVMAVVLFCLEARIGSSDAVGGIGVLATVLLGVTLGWRRRVPSVLIAPFVSWLWAWIPLWIAAMVHDGFFGGLAIGFFLVTLGWLGIGLLEVVLAGLVAVLVRGLRGPGEDDRIVIFGPGHQD